VSKARSLTDTEAEEDDDEEEVAEVGPTMCKWENCELELSSLDDLINHVKTDHIGSGKVSNTEAYYKEKAFFLLF
jgi:hypothetical protein